MITQEEFNKLIERYQKFEKSVNTLSEVFPCSFESDIVNYGEQMFSDKLLEIFTPEGFDWIAYYLWEPEHSVRDKDGNDIPFETLEDLWEMVKTYIK